MIRVHAGGNAFTHEIYALSETPGGDRGVTPQQASLRQDVADFVAAVTAPGRPLLGPAHTTEPMPFTGEAIAIRAQVVSPGGDPVPAAGLEPQVAEWPLADLDPERARRCVVVRGVEAEKLADVLDEASTATSSPGRQSVLTPGQAPAP